MMSQISSGYQNRIISITERTTKDRQKVKEVSIIQSNKKPPEGRLSAMEDWQYLIFLLRDYTGNMTKNSVNGYFTVDN